MTVTPAVFLQKPRVCSCGCAWVSTDPSCWSCGQTCLPATCLPAGANAAGPRLEAVGKALTL